MQQRSYCERLAEQIHACLAEGIRPEPEVRHYIDSTFALPSRRELEIILKDPDSCEQETLLELIFFPGIDTQVLLENLIEEYHFQQNEEDVILGMLMEKKPVTALYYPEGAPPVRLATPEHAARQFIARLNIHKQIDRGVLGAIHQCLPADQQLPAKVMIRNARFACQGAKAAFLKAFVGNMSSMLDGFLGHLEFVLHFLETSPDDTPLKEALADRKQQHRKNIIRAEQFEKQRQNRNVETMMLQGIRIPHFDPQDDIQKITLIDTVSIAIYNRTF
jgi:hypothetical protein